MKTLRLSKFIFAVGLLVGFSSASLQAAIATPIAKDFLKCLPISISAAAQSVIGENSANDIPVLVRISESIPGFSYADLEADGSDLAFGVDNGGSLTIYPHEIETWNPDGVSLIWVKVPTLSASTAFSMYYGNGVTVADASASVWSNYVGVWHLDETNVTAVANSYGEYRNSTATSGINGHLAEKSIANEPGKFGQAFRVNDVTKLKTGNYNYGGVWVPGTDALKLGGTFTISGWFKGGATGYYYDHMFFKRAAADNKAEKGATGAFAIEINASSGTTFKPCVRGNSSTAASFNVGSTVYADWKYVTFVFNGTTVSMYVNGVSAGSGTISAATDNDAALVFGNNCKVADGAVGDAAWAGWIDEVRIMDDVPDATWVAIEYAAMAEDGLLSFGAIEQLDDTAMLFDGVPTVSVDGEGVLTLSVTVTGGQGTLEAVYTNLTTGDETTRTLVDNAMVTESTVYTDQPPLVSGYTYSVKVVNISPMGSVVTRDAAENCYVGAFTVTAGENASEQLLTPGTFVIARADSAGDLVVRYSTSGGEGTFEPLSGYAVIPDGESSVTIEVNPVYNPDVDADADVTLALSAGPYPAQTGTATITVVNSSVDIYVRYVSTEGDDEKDGLTLQTAKKTVRAAIESLEGFDAEPSQVFIAPGTYEEASTVNYNGVNNANYRLIVTNAVTLIGTGEDPSQVVLKNKSGRARVLFLDNAQAGIRNLTLSNGQAYQAGSYGGGNLYIGYDGGTASNCVFTGGSADNFNCHAGNVFMRAGLVTHCVIEKGYFTDNRGDYKAGGIEIYGGLVENCLIHGNYDNCNGTQTKAAAGVMISGGMIRNCTIAANSGKQVGGICVNGTAGVVENCVIVGNTATMADESIAGDVVSYMVSAEDAKAVFRNCVVDAATAPNATCVSASSAATLVDSGNGDFHLAAGSPAINFGRAKENEASGDLDLNERVMGSAIDAGCYEYDLNAFAIAFEADVVSGILPVDVTFTAVVSGVNDGDYLEYDWDFDGDGVVDATLDGTATAQYQFVGGGMFSPSLTVKNLTAQKELSISKSHYLQFAPRVLYVNKNAESHVVPFATPETGALTVNEAIAAAVDGCEIVIYPGTYGVTSTLTVEKVLDIHGLLPDPEEVVLTREGSSWLRVVEMNKTEAKLSNVVIEKGLLSGASGGGVHFGDLGGTVSNVVIRGCGASNYNGAGGAAYLASEHALLTHCVISNCYVQTMNGAGGNKGVLQVEKGRAENCLVSGCYCPLGNNETDRPGNAVHIGANGSVVNCTIVRN
ncbi:MAG: hypothetical protein II840_13165, partial [Kiritimatiellae bacterium]|nr:hypothetical protein [Kiritimatiellia bacterium]